MTILTATLQSRAEEKLSVEYNDGQTFSYVLSNRPKVKFVGNTMNITAPEIDDIHQMSDVKQFRFSKTSSIDAINAAEHRITYTDNETVRLDGFKPGGDVSVYNTKGSIMIQRTIEADGSAVIPLDALTSGTYIISTTEGKSCKIIKQ
ncbi:T9SS type A sorting domain-containing protein [uncultured Muribaculum sp.]|uniref:T9SS type A sorting domain-containing protein n=1 Tax=uncultured Muribaculum sp. TaxID=1918613 RepID=UPI0025FE3D4F|nr:T9SS type A sorting domain-containing protein [uncultured Muribaculum sp.]